MNFKSIGPNPSFADAPDADGGGYDHINSADIEGALTPIREAIILIRRHVEADAPHLNEVIKRRPVESALQSEIAKAEHEAGPSGEWAENVVLDILVYIGMAVTGHRTFFTH